MIQNKIYNLFIKRNILYYGVIFIVILLSYPFLRYPFDIYHHLIMIDEFSKALTILPDLSISNSRLWINNGTLGIGTVVNGTEIIPDDSYVWHYIWAKIFIFMHIENLQIFFRARVIHITQIIIALFSVYYFSHVILRNFFKKIDSTSIKWLSFWSTIIWLSIYATFSAGYHQIWIMWYSVNNQITLPLFWYIIALTFVLFLENTTIKKKLFFIFQILILSKFILQTHSMEFMYYLMHILVFTLVYIDKVYLLIKKYFYLFIPLVGSIVYFIKYYQPEKSKIFDYMSIEKIPQLYEKIMQEGNVLLSGYNRAAASINELMYVIGMIGIIFTSYSIFVYIKDKKVIIDIRMALFIFITSLFVLIPLYQFSGGLFAMITKTMVVNRLYYSSSIFVLLPIIIYAILQNKVKKIIYIHLMMACILLGTFIYSRYDIGHTQNYYKNIQSIKNSFYERRVGFNLSQKQINRIGLELQLNEKKNKYSRKIFYYARADIAFVIKYIYHKEVYWKGRRANPDYVKEYNKNKNNKDYLQILFEVPKDFPPYVPYT